MLPVKPATMVKATLNSQFEYMKVVDVCRGLSLYL